MQWEPSRINLEEELTGLTTWVMLRQVSTILYTLFNLLTYPGPIMPRFPVSSLYGTRLERSLVPVARALSSFDRKIIKRVQALDKRVASNTDEVRKTDALYHPGELRDIDNQFNDIYWAKYGFNELYLKDERFIAFWRIALQHIRIVLESKESNNNHTKKRDVFEQIFLSYWKLAFKLRDAIIDAVSEDILEQEVLDVISERWTPLDEILDWYHEHTNTSRTVPSWSVKKIGV
jgi:hypothetical protein